MNKLLAPEIVLPIMFLSITGATWYSVSGTIESPLSKLETYKEHKKNIETTRQDKVISNYQTLIRKHPELKIE
jgi:hypothetical protein